MPMTGSSEDRPTDKDHPRTAKGRLRLPRSAPRTLERQLAAQGYRAVAGVDEVGRGCLAGPVVAAAVVMPDTPAVPHVTDSKQLTPVQREEIAAQIREVALGIGLGIVAASVIDATNILRATHAAMRTALQDLGEDVDYALVDGRPVPNLPVKSEAIVGGDRRCYCIAAASIIAKVYRDTIMECLECYYPGYGFAEHKGYATAQHCEALERLGPCPAHRLSFEPLRSRGQGRLDL